MITAALSIAGSDPSGGAGIQADLETFHSLGVDGLTVIAALTAQNSARVLGVFPVPAHFVGLQLDSVFSRSTPGAVKTGMLGTAEIVRVVAEKILEFGVTQLVIDPVMVSTSGAPLLEPDAIEVLKKELMPLAALITPNLAEAAVLTGLPVADVQGMRVAAKALHRLGARSVLVKGGHLEGEAVDVLFDGESYREFASPRIPTRGVRGTGCRLSAAIAAHLAEGASLPEAIRGAKQFISAFIAANTV